MTPARWQEIERLYHSAQEHGLAVLNGTDPEIRRQVEDLLAQDSPGKLLDRPARDLLSWESEGTRTVTLSAGEPGPGTRLGPYLIESRIGAGGMGEVFRAIDTRLGRAVAVKTNREQFNPRFGREARAISSLNHPNICTLFDVGPNYLVMELVEGESLAARLKQGPVPTTSVLLYGSQIAAALMEAHGKGIVHRDLKPGNIMIGKTGVKVLDFGLARTIEDETVTLTNMVVGTPAYMAPEQREGQPADARSDIYSLGCVLYEMLMGERATSQRKRLGTGELDAIVSRCLEQDPARRWQSAAEVEQELSAIGQASPGHYRAAPPNSQPPPKPALKNKIVLGEFENKTGDPAFDEILRESVSMQLEEAPFLTIVSEQQTQQTLRFMNHPPEIRPTSEVAREICERIGGLAVLDGSIASLGTQFILRLRARNCCTGDLIGQQQAVAASKDEVLHALTRITDQVRELLNESMANAEQAQPLDQVTTSSLEALKAFCAARVAVNSRGFSAALPHLERALALDPQFAMALAQYGFYCGQTGQIDRARERTLKAYEYRDCVSDWERFYILFVYHREVTGNARKELENIETWAQAYPLDYLPWGVLGGWCTRGTGQYERGVQACERCIQLNAQSPFPYEGLAIHHTSLGRFAEAATALQRAEDLQIEIPYVSVARYYLAFLRDDESGKKREIDRARGHREAEDWIAHHQALVLARAGKMESARIMWRHAMIWARQNDDLGKAAIYRAAAAVCEAHSGNLAAAIKLAQDALELGNGRDAKYAVAFALALSGNHSQSQDLAAELANQFPEDTTVQFAYLPTLHALFALSQNAPLEAIEHLQTALPYDLAMPGTAFWGKFGGLYTVYVRGQAYMAAGRGLEAAGEFQRVLNHRGIVLADPIGALAHLQLGRARVLSGEMDQARSAYQQFLSVWKNADADLPVLQQATAEYARL